MMEHKENWYIVKKISANTYLINEQDMATMYLLTGTKRALLIDTGMGLGDLRSLVGQLTDLPIMVLNTHGHCDHIWGNYMFEETYLSKKDEGLYRYQAAEDYRRSRSEGFISAYPTVFSRNEMEEWIRKPPGKIHYIEDYSFIDLGDRKLELIPLSGHTEGSIMVLDLTEKILFSGDAINQHLWMQLKDSKNVSVYYEGLLNFKKYISEVKTIFHGHTKDDVGLDNTFIKQVTEDVKGIIEGTVIGYPENHWSGKCLRYDFENWSIWYKNI
ncbi:MAG: MBL fold metallo-hydrolase, partial [Acetanaerobacterium sp.]